MKKSTNDTCNLIELQKKLKQIHGSKYASYHLSDEIFMRHGGGFSNFSISTVEVTKK